MEGDVLRIGVFTDKMTYGQIVKSFKDNGKRFSRLTGLDLSKLTFELVYINHYGKERRFQAFQNIFAEGPGTKIDLILFDMDMAPYDDVNHLLKENPELAAPTISTGDMITRLVLQKMNFALMLAYINRMPAWGGRLFVYRSTYQYDPDNIRVDEKRSVFVVPPPVYQVENTSLPVYVARDPDSYLLQVALPGNGKSYTRDAKMDRLAIIGLLDVHDKPPYYRYTEKAITHVLDHSLTRFFQWLYEWHPQTKRQTKLAMKDAFSYDKRLTGDRFNPETFKVESVSNMPEVIEDEIASYLGKLKLASDTPLKKKKPKQKLLLVDSSSDSDGDSD